MVSAHPHSFRLHLKRWGRSVGGFHDDKVSEKSVWLFVSACSWTDDEFVLSNGEQVYSRDFRLVVYPGEPLLRDGTQITGGGGILSYVPAYDELASSFDGRVYVDQECFADICSLLPAMATGGYECDLRMALSGLEFKLPETFVWDVDANPHIVIQSFQFGITSKAPPEDDGQP